jgi:hypothetical protein
MKDKARHLISGAQIKELKELSMNGDFRKILILASKFENEQYIGDSEKTIKEDLSSCRIVIGD